MIIKHWQGYGQVTAIKRGAVKTIKNTDYSIAGIGEELCQVKITVFGNHECGVERNDTYDVLNWLLKKFDRSMKNAGPRSIVDLKTATYYQKVDGVDTEHCDYTITYRKAG
jgi:hypothetical protein